MIRIVLVDDAVGVHVNDRHRAISVIKSVRIGTGFGVNNERPKKQRETELATGPSDNLSAVTGEFFLHSATPH